MAKVSSRALSRFEKARDNPDNKELSVWQMKVAAELDYEMPGWDIYWAQQDELQSFASNSNRAYLRSCVAERLFYQILWRAKEAGVVTGLDFD